MSRALLFAIFVFALAGCSDASGPPRLDTGLPSETPADELTTEEAVAACEAYEDVANATLGPAAQEEVGCTLLGVAAELTGTETCAEASASCAASDQIAPTPVDFNCETATSFAPSGCTATVGELEACVNAYAAGIDAFKAEISCDLVSDLEALAAVLADFQPTFEPTAYPECASLSAECLALLGWTDAATPAPPAM